MLSGVRFIPTPAALGSSRLNRCTKRSYEHQVHPPQPDTNKVPTHNHISDRSGQQSRQRPLQYSPATSRSLELSEREKKKPPAGPFSEGVGAGWLGAGVVVVWVGEAGFPPRSDTQGAYQEPGHGVQAGPLRGRCASLDAVPGTLVRRSCPTEEGTPPRPVVAGPGRASAGRWYENRAGQELYPG